MTVGSPLRRAWQAFMAPAEDPRKVLPDVHERQLEVLTAVRRARDSLRVTSDQLAARAVARERRLPALESEARRALVAGREDLARIALQQREVASAELGALETQAAELADKQRRLALLEQRLSGEIEAHREREGLLAARHSAAEARVRISESLAAVAQELAGLDLVHAQTEETTEQLEARASVIDRMTDVGGLADPERLLEDLVERRAPGVDVSAAVEARLRTLTRELESGHFPALDD